MHDYSIHRLDAMGQLLTTEQLPFANRNAAISFADQLRPANAIVEVWSEDALVIRMFRDPPPADGFGIDPPSLALAAFSRADRLLDEAAPGATDLGAADLATTFPAVRESIIIHARVPSPFAVSNETSAWAPFLHSGFVPWRRTGAF
jgi:hypothetical protein